MKKFLITGSSLVAVAAAGSAGAVDLTLGGSIDMGVEFGLGKNADDLSFSTAFNEISLSISAAHTTDGGLAFGGAFGLSTSAEIEFGPYADAAGDKWLAKRTVDGRTNIAAQVWNVSGGGPVESADIASVKIASSWRGIDMARTGYSLALGRFTSSNICKLAGRAGGNGSLFTPEVAGTYFPSTTNPGSFTVAALALGAARGDYLPAGQRFHLYESHFYGITNSQVQIPAGVGFGWQALSTTRGAKAQITFGADDITVVTITRPASVTLTSGKTKYVAVNSKAAVDLNGDGADDVTSAAVFAGPFMEVKMASSDTKMVVGAACLEGQEDSETAFYMDNVSKVMAASDASIYIEGGFGKLTLQSSDYTGGVSAIAGAGDQADIDADGMVVVAQGYGLLGASPFLAMDLNKGDSLGDIEVITGGTFDLGGLSAAFDVALDNPSDVFGISAWDLGGSYAMGDLAIGFATDSSSSWGLSAAMDIAGLGVSTTFGSSSPGDHKKTGITYSVGVTAALSGYNLAVGFDQDLQPTVGVDYDLGGLKLYGKYDAGDEEGSVGATLSF